MLYFVNRYVYSWTGVALSKVGFCDYKTVGVPWFSDSPVALTSALDLEKMRSALRAKPEYRINYRPGHLLGILRMFDGVSYVLVFSVHSRLGKDVISLNMSTDSSFQEYDGSVANRDRYYSNDLPPGTYVLLSQPTKREGCSTPSQYLRNNVYLMIDDLPLNESEKRELKRYVSVHNLFDFSLPLS